MIINKQLEIFVKCFYVRTKIGLRTLSLVVFLEVGLDWILILKYWSGLRVEKVSVRLSLLALFCECVDDGMFAES